MEFLRLAEVVLLWAQGLDGAVEHTAQVESDKGPGDGPASHEAVGVDGVQ